MQIAIYIIVAYGVLVLLGGVIGYYKSKSKMSIIMGVLMGGGVTGSALAAIWGNPYGFQIAMALCGVLLIVFNIRYFMTKKFMPGGLFSILTIVVLAVAALGYFGVLK